MSTTYKYKASNDESYNSLAAYAVTLPVTVTLFPQLKTIAVSEDASKEVGEFIDNEALDFIIDTAQSDVDDIDTLLVDPTSDTSILRDIAESFQADKKASAEQYLRLAQERDEILVELKNKKRDADNYSNWWREECAKNSRIHEQIEAISVLLKTMSSKG